MDSPLHPITIREAIIGYGPGLRIWRAEALRTGDLVLIMRIDQMLKSVDSLEHGRALDPPR